MSSPTATPSHGELPHGRGGGQGVGRGGGGHGGLVGGAQELLAPRRSLIKVRRAVAAKLPVVTTIAVVPHRVAVVVTLFTGYIDLLLRPVYLNFGPGLVTICNCEYITVQRQKLLLISQSAQRLIQLRCRCCKTTSFR